MISLYNPKPRPKTSTQILPRCRRDDNADRRCRQFSRLPGSFFHGTLLDRPKNKQKVNSIPKKTKQIRKWNPIPKIEWRMLGKKRIQFTLRLKIWSDFFWAFPEYIDVYSLSLIFLGGRVISHGLSHMDCLKLPADIERMSVFMLVHWREMEVSWNGGTPKSSILLGYSL